MPDLISVGKPRACHATGAENVEAERLFLSWALGGAVAAWAPSRLSEDDDRDDDLACSRPLLLTRMLGRSNTDLGV